MIWLFLLKFGSIWAHDLWGGVAGWAIGPILSGHVQIRGGNDHLDLDPCCPSAASKNIVPPPLLLMIFCLFFRLSFSLSLFPPGAVVVVQTFRIQWAPSFSCKLLVQLRAARVGQFVCLSDFKASTTKETSLFAISRITFGCRWTLILCSSSWLKNK